MDDNQKPTVTDVESQQSIKEPLTDFCTVKIEEIVESNDQDVAGPSTATVPVFETPTLPGAVENLPETVKNPIPGTVQATPKAAQKAGLSKSEHNIRHIITAEDVARALNSNFANLKPTKLNFKGKEIPLIHRKALSPTELAEKPCCPLLPTGQNVHVVLSSVHANVPNSSLVTSNVQTEVPAVKTNEVIVTKTNVVAKISRLGSDTKKKTSANPSERSDFGLTTRDSLSSIGSNVCRICMTRGRERLISPCNCKGSLANVHLTCLERWLNQVGRNHCELCGFSYPAIRTPRYTVLQALRLWFGNPRNRSHLQSDCLIFWLLSTVTAGLLAVCIIGTEYFVIEGGKFGKHGVVGGARTDEGISHRITETAMDFFMAIVLCGYSVTVYLLWKDHYVMWNRWRRANVNVRLLLTPDSNPVPFVPRNCRYDQV